MIDLDDPALGVDQEEVEAAWQAGQGGKMQIVRRLKIRNLKIAMENARDLATLRKAMTRLMEFIH